VTQRRQPPAPDAAVRRQAPGASAEAVFGACLSQAVRYAELLCTVGVERGLLGPREVERIWSRHLLNSAAIAPLVPTKADVLDLGSGAGLPGIPLALARPDLHVTLVEPMARRVNFLLECLRGLDVDVEVRRARAQELPPACASVVVARALAPLDRLLPLALPLLRPGGVLLAMKGRAAQEEVRAAEPMLRSWPGVQVRLDLIGEGADTVRVVVVSLPGRRQRGGPPAPTASRQPKASSA